jgi:hypothetical protein
MTVKELYEWAERHNCLDIKLAKFCNLEIEDITSVNITITDGYFLTQKEVEKSGRVVLT